MTLSIIAICIAAVLITAIICFTGYKRDTQLHETKERLEHYKGRCLEMENELCNILYHQDDQKKKMDAIYELYNKD